MKRILLVCAAALLATALAIGALAQQATPQPVEEPTALPPALATVAATPITAPPAAEQPTVTTQVVTVTGDVTSSVITTEAVTTTVIVTTTTAVTEVQVITEPAPAVELVITETVPAALIAINLDAINLGAINLGDGLPLDPFLVSVNGGGPFSAAGLGPGCSGYISNAPVVSVNWTGTASLLELFFYSDHDPVLVIRTPTGQILCNDDANHVLLDPVIQIDAPPPGVYNVWVGSYDRDQLIPGLLVLTTDPAMNIGAFRPGDLVTREPIPEVAVRPAEVRRTLLPTVTAPVAGAVTPLQLGTTPISLTVVVTGVVPAFDLPIQGALCSGYINPHIDLSFSWPGGAENLRIFFEGDGDSSLLIIGPGGMVYCNDDAARNQNLNPVVTIPNAPPGDYLVFVGRLDPLTPLSGTL
ncbi:MAG TPA: hypothetical protein VNK95_09130, partial [Caldilineaceae bacterium]|nr:hypothetical protein [Caldilineaceae bacterium]